MTGHTRTTRRAELAGKRLVDIFVTTVALILTLPVLATTAVILLICDGRPIFFRQQRVGRQGKPFTMLKFRTMVAGAERMRGELEAQNERRGPLFKMTHDPRVTRLGRLLRDASIDELPQLLNVLRGDMSLVGPRPALVAEAAAFDPDFERARETVRPGITGLWQIGARDEPDFAEYERLDRLYIERRTLRLDLGILLLTLPTVLAQAWHRFSTQRRAISGVETAGKTVSWHLTDWYERMLADAQPIPVPATYRHQDD